MNSLAIVVPCYNESAVLGETCSRLVWMLRRLQKAGKISAESRIYFVDDGSSDETWSMIEAFAADGLPVHGVKLSRNRGHQNALLAGLLTAQGDMLVSMDADLQDDVLAIEAMVDRYRDGCDIVYGVRQTRKTDGAVKYGTAALFYRLMRWMGTDTIPHHADFRLMSRRAIEALRQYREVNLFLRGVVPSIGLRSAIVYYDRATRYAGVSKYSPCRMLGLAIDGITSFSVAPLRMISLLGLAVFLLTVAMSGWILWARLFTDAAVPGWASIVLPVAFLGGIQLLCLGVIGEYLGKLYAESKARPRFIIEKSASASSAPSLDATVAAGPYGLDAASAKNVVPAR
jgi:polyisoprenyl-phosphate glycosyltransferase